MMDDFDTLPKMAGWHESKLTGPIETFIPTPQLRFVKRVMYGVNDPPVMRVLQQWWASTTKFKGGEWRDVPLEEEKT